MHKVRGYFWGLAVLQPVAEYSNRPETPGEPATLLNQEADSGYADIGASGKSHHTEPARAVPDNRQVREFARQARPAAHRSPLRNERRDPQRTLPTQTPAAARRDGGAGYGEWGTGDKKKSGLRTRNAPWKRSPQPWHYNCDGHTAECLPE